MKKFSLKDKAKIDITLNERLGRRLLTVMLILYIVFFTFVSFLKFNSFSYKDIDLATAAQAFHNVFRGHFFEVCHGDFTLFAAGHLPLIIIILSPVYMLLAHPFTLLFLQSLFLGLGILGVYFIAREVLDSDFALCFAFMYCIYPALNYVNLFEERIQKVIKEELEKVTDEVKIDKLGNVIGIKKAKKRSGKSAPNLSIFTSSVTFSNSSLITF